MPAESNLNTIGDDICVGLFTTDAVAGLLHVTPKRVKAWRTAGLIEPTVVRCSVEYYDFAQLSAARSLCELVRSGLKPARLRQVLASVRALVAGGLPLSSLLSRDGRVLRRTSDEDVAEADGQLQLIFDSAASTKPLKLHGISERSASEWFHYGTALEGESDLKGAADAYRHALQQGGPDAEVCFALAFVLAEIGDTAAAIERYRETVEINPDYGDAWNNLGALLSDEGERDRACEAFQQAIRANPSDSRAHYNLADTLDELGRNWEATPHWQQYLRHDKHSAWAQHARGRIN